MPSPASRPRTSTRSSSTCSACSPRSRPRRTSSPSGNGNVRPVRFDPFTDAAIDDPYPQYGWFGSHEPVHWSGKLRSWVLFRHDDVSAFFRDDARLSSDRSPPEVRGAIRTVSSDPPAHDPVRAILKATLAPRVRTISPRVEE